LIWIAPLAILGMALFIAVGGWVVQLLWNWLLPPLLGWPHLGFWQALGLLALCRILFGGFGGHGCSRPSVRHRVSDRIRDRLGDRVAERWAERFGALTPEERERFRQRVRERWGFDPSGDAGQGPDSGAK
jgi:hypothetical protein